MATNLFPQMNPTQIFKPIHKLLLHNIYDIKHLTLSNGINMMSHVDFEYYYTKSTKLMKQTLNTAIQFFCQPRCNPNCQNICPIYHPPRTLKQEYIILEHNLEPRIREAPIHPPIHPPIPPHPPHPISPTYIKKQSNKIPYLLNNQSQREYI